MSIIETNKLNKNETYLMETAIAVSVYTMSVTMIYRPTSGAMWDPSVFYHNGKYHAFMMYDKDGHAGLWGSKHCLYAASEDGVHWKDEKIVLKEREDETLFFKCFVGRCGDRFIMNHGVRRPEVQDTLRFYESTDLTNWEYLFSSNPDPKWYKGGKAGRWDCMYTLPKQEDAPDHHLLEKTNATCQII